MKYKHSVEILSASAYATANSLSNELLMMPRQRRCQQSIKRATIFSIVIIEVAKKLSNIGV